jgi:hypothetical protein
MKRGIIYKMDADEFYDIMKEPDSPDEMLFEIRSTNPDLDRTFSADALDGMLDQIHAFVLARAMAFWRRSGTPPKHLRIALALGLGVGEAKDKIESFDLPYYTYDDPDLGLLQADGETRIPRNKNSP